MAGRPPAPWPGHRDDVLGRGKRRGRTGRLGWRAPARAGGGRRARRRPPVGHPVGDLRLVATALVAASSRRGVRAHPAEARLALPLMVRVPRERPLRRHRMRRSSARRPSPPRRSPSGSRRSRGSGSSPELSRGSVVDALGRAIRADLVVTSTNSARASSKRRSTTPSWPPVAVPGCTPPPLGGPSMPYRGDRSESARTIRSTSAIGGSANVPLAAVVAPTPGSRWRAAKPSVCRRASSNRSASGRRPARPGDADRAPGLPIVG